MKDRSKKPSPNKRPDDRAARPSAERQPFERFRAKPKPAPARADGKFAERKENERPKLGGKGKKRPDEVQKITVLPRLNQYIAKAGVCSRREADELILTGKVKVNGKIIREMGRRVQLDDKVEYEGRLLRGEELRYILLNKPKGFIANVTDEKERKTVMDLIKHACQERVYPVGRLEKETTGLLLFTNDGDLARQLTHPATRLKQIYHVYLNKGMAEEDIEKLMKGVALEDGTVKADVVNYVAGVTDGTQVGAQFHSGRNTFVRSMFEHVGYEVTKLDRALYGNLTKKDLPRGKWRPLKDKEVIMLKLLAGKSDKAPVKPTKKAPKKP
jgi:23S rRNA pseudouridine2605 synthase